MIYERALPDSLVAAGEHIGILPDDAVDILAVDIAPTGPDQTSDEKKVSIFAKDSRFPYHYAMKKELVEAAKRANGGIDLNMAARSRKGRIPRSRSQSASHTETASANPRTTTHDVY